MVPVSLPQKKRYKKACLEWLFSSFGDSVLRRDSMDIEEQEQKFDQSLEQLSYSTTRLTNTLVCWCVLAATLFENKASLAQLHWRFVQSGGEGATSQERIVLFPTKSGISIDCRAILPIAS